MIRRHALGGSEVVIADSSQLSKPGKVSDVLFRLKGSVLGDPPILVTEIVVVLL